MMYAIPNAHSVEWSRSPPSLMYRHVEPPPMRTAAFCAEGCSSAVAQQRTEDVTTLCTPNMSECYFAINLSIASLVWWMRYGVDAPSKIEAKNAEKTKKSMAGRTPARRLREAAKKIKGLN